MLHCKKTLAADGLLSYFQSRSEASVSLLLGRFLPKLGGAARRRLFFCGVQDLVGTGGCDLLHQAIEPAFAAD